MEIEKSDITKLEYCSHKNEIDVVKVDTVLMKIEKIGYLLKDTWRL